MTTKLPIIRTVQNSFGFVKNNFDHAVRVLMPIVPFMIVANFVVTFGVGDGEGNAAVAAVSGVFYAILYLLTYCAVLIVWHRAYLNGPSDSNRVEIMSMTRTEWEFAGKMVLFCLVCTLVVVLVMTAGFIGGAVIGALVGLAFGAAAMKIAVLLFGVIGMFAGITAGAAWSLRYMLYFPAKATGNYIGFRESFRLSKGLGWRLMVMNLIPGLLSMLITGIYLALMTYIFHRDEVALAMDAASYPERTKEMPDGSILYTAEDGTTWTVGSGMNPTFSPEGIVEFILNLPITVILPTLCAMVVANNLSQTYRWVVENRR